MKKQTITHAARRWTLVLAAAMTAAGTAGAADKTATITVNANTKYQQIDGFGGTAMNSQWGDVYTQQKVNLLWGRGEGQVGLNIMRLRVNPNESNWGEYSNPVKWARRVNPSLQVFATPWSPPKKYKTQNTTKYQNDFGTWVWPLVEHSWGGQGSNGGAINPDCYADYADFLERYRQTMEQKGAPVDIISVQNECDYTPTATTDGVEHASYESCIYSPKEMAAMCKALRQRLDPKCRVMGPETFGWGQHNYNTTLAGLQDAVDNIDLWGNHMYGTNNWAFVNTVKQKTGKHMWQTEFLIDYPSDYDGNFAKEYEMIECIHKAMTAGYNAYVYYSMATHFFASNHGGSDTQLWKRAWVFSHYAKYATGRTRINAALSNTGNALNYCTAYASPSGDTISVMLLNKSADTYRVTVTLPFAPQVITQVATGDVANALTTDVSEKYANGTSRPVVTVRPGMFYTFQFVRQSGEQVIQAPATSPKPANYGNPLSATHFMADPTAIEHDGRLYVYATDDQQEFAHTDGLTANTYGHIQQLVCMSTADMVNWTMHDAIDVKAVAPWISASWAPSIVSRQEADGKTHFYLYFTNGGAGIGVLTSTSPTGPWTDPLGHALVDGFTTPGLGKIASIIDPGVGISDDGSEAYLTFGGGDVSATELQPGNARIVRLGADMISLDGDIKPISAPCHFEANELNYINGKWVFSYCTRWTISSDWSTYSKQAAPGAASIVYMLSTDPMADNWSYKGVVMPQPGTLGYPYGNNHTHMQKFQGKWYILYHTQWLEQQMGLAGGYRNLQISPLTVNLRNVVISALTSSTASVKGLSPLAGVVVNPFEEQPGSMAAVATADWWMVRNVDFAAADAPARSLVLKVQGSGTLEVRPATVDAAPIVTATFSTTGEQTIVVPLASEQQARADYLYFVFTSMAAAKVLSWQFDTRSADDILTGISVVQPAAAADSPCYNLSGQRVDNPSKGIYIRRGRKVVKK